MNLLKVAAAVQRTGRTIEKGTGLICVVLFSGMTITALLGVFFRYVMQNPFQWTEEVARYIMIWLGFLAINMAMWRGEHIVIPLLTGRLGPGTARVVATLVNLMIGGFLVILLYQGWRMTANTMMTAQSMPVSMVWFYLAIPVSAGLTLIQTILVTVASWLPRPAAPQSEG